MMIGYARTSTLDQKAGFEDQLAQLATAGVEPASVFREQVSAMSERPQLDGAIRFCRPGDTLIVTKLDRLARSVKDLLAIIAKLEANNVSLRILDFGGSAMDTRGPTGKLVLTLVGAIGEFERSMLLERQRAGVAVAKAAGRYKGRKPTARRQAPAILERHARGVGVTQIAEELKISRVSIYRVLNAAKAR